MMKKILSFSLSLAFILALSLPAFAASNGPDIPTEPAAYTVTVNAVSYTHLDVYKRQLYPSSWASPFSIKTGQKPYRIFALF